MTTFSAASASTELTQNAPPKEEFGTDLLPIFRARVYMIFI